MQKIQYGWFGKETGRMVEEAEGNVGMSALAILTCRQNSHPFQERHIALLEAIKIGRSVARARPAPNNGIFDCKVLSRNHAMLWYENGIFYLQDTKSSNGTFVNDQRLCKGGEESAPREVYHGDLIQFGVNVMENNRRGEKITHGCIIATIALYHPDGREAKPVLFNTPTPGITIQSQELYKLAQYLQEAHHREKMLEQKLCTLQELVHNTQESSEGGWQALIDEDRLLSRLEVLENQLHVFSKNHAEDTLRTELVTLQEEKVNYETTAKESLMKVLEEKIEAVTKLSDLERSLTRSEDECGHMKDMCDKLQEELQLLAEKYQDQLKAVQDIQIQLHDAESKHLEDMEKVEKDKLELSDKLEMMIKQETLLTAKIEILEADKDISNEQVTTMKAKLDQMKEPNEDDIINNLKSMESDSENEVITPPSVDKDNKDEIPEDVQGKLKETQQQIEDYKCKLEESDKLIQESAAKVEDLQNELETSRLESLQYVAKMAALEDKLKLSDLHMNQMVENTMADLTLQMSESNKQSDSSNDLITSLQSQIFDLEHELSTYRVAAGQPERMDSTLVSCSIDTIVDEATLRAKPSHEDSELDKLLKEAKMLLSKTEHDLVKTKDELTETVEQRQKLTDENSALKTDLTQAQSSLQDKSNLVIDLQDQLQRAENTTQEVNVQILELKDQLGEEQKFSKQHQGEITALQASLEKERQQLHTALLSLKDAKGDLEIEKGKQEISEKSLAENKKLLSESQETIKQCETETPLKHSKSSTMKKLNGSSDSVKHHTSADSSSTPATAASRRKQQHQHARHSPDIVELRKKEPLKRRYSPDTLQDRGSKRDVHKRYSPDIVEVRRRELTSKDSAADRRATTVSPHLRYSFHTPDTTKLPVSKRQATEFSALRDECSGLRKRIQAIEGDMKMSRKENLQLSCEYNKLQESYRELEELKDRLQDRESTWMSNLTDSQKQNESSKQELMSAKEEINELKKRCEDCDEEIARLQVELKTMSTDYARIAGRSKIISFVSCIPLLMLLFAILLALYPTLETLTAT